MQKVYLLLRNNQQTGPYSFEELLALHLKPFDLVWIEGKSHGWRYPNEVEALKSYVAAPESPKPIDFGEVIQENPRQTSTPSPTPNSAKNVFVSMPNTGNRNVAKERLDPIEQKAEELRKRAQAYTHAQESTQTNYTRDLYNAEEEYTKWVYEKKTTKKKGLNKKTVSIVAAGIFILSVGWWAGSKLFKDSSISAPPVVHQQQEPAEPQLSFETETEANDQSTEKAVSPIVDATAKRENKKSGGQEKKVAVQEKKLSEAEDKTTSKVEIVEVGSEEDNTSEPEAAQKNETGVIAEAPVEKKKTFKEKIGDLFKNKKTEQSENKSEPGSGNERSATRRGEDKEAATSITDVSGQVEIKTNKINDSWMMGVKNLKLTLFNRSELTISSAKVEVLYYSEQNNLLEKKTLSFSNIPARKSQTVAAPDQRLADHIETKVLFANGLDNAYARQ